MYQDRLAYLQCNVELHRCTRVHMSTLGRTRAAHILTDARERERRELPPPGMPSVRGGVSEEQLPAGGDPGGWTFVGKQAVHMAAEQLPASPSHVTEGGTVTSRGRHLAGGGHPAGVIDVAIRQGRSGRSFLLTMQSLDFSGGGLQ